MKPYFKLIAIFALSFFNVVIMAQSFVVNEIQTMNIDQNIDPTYNFGGWVELYNPTSDKIDITGFYLSDNADNLELTHIGVKMSIPANGFQVLWFDHHSSKYLSQIDMNLDCDGGTLYISDKAGNLLIAQDYPKGIGRTSYARTVDGGEEWSLTSMPTPGASNSTSIFASQQLDAPIVDTESQFFTSSFDFNVEIPEGTTLRYTTDCSAPSATNGEVSLDGMFSVSSSSIYRFCLVADGFLTSPVATRTFIKESKQYTIPRLVINAAPEFFYGDQLGIFVRGKNGCLGYGQKYPCNWNMDWERPANFEYFTVEGDLVVSQEVGVERCGWWSRAYEPYPFKVKANKRYNGENQLPYQFFKEKPYLKHKTLQVRNGGNDRACRIKDASIQEIVFRSGIDIDCQAYQPVVHYINGVDKGTINVREPNNKHYAYANYGYDDDEIDQFEMSLDSGYVQKCGTKESFYKWYKLSKTCEDNQTYKEIAQIVDIDAFVNYMAVQLYIGNTDWPQNNMKAFKHKDGRYRFVLCDLDLSFKTDTPLQTFFKKSKYRFNYLYDLKTRYYLEIEMVTIFKNMLQNKKFIKQFIDEFCLVGGSVFEPNRCAEIIDELSTIVEKNGQMPWTIANEVKSSLSTSRQKAMISHIKEYFSSQKKSLVEEQKVKLSCNIDEGRLFVNNLPVPTNKFDGYLFAPIELRVCAPAGYRFVGWQQQTSNNSQEIVCTDETFIMPTSDDLILKACYEEIPTDERDGFSTYPVVINEISAANSIYVSEYNKRSDWVELYNTTSSDVDIEGWYISDNEKKPTKYKITSDGSLASTIIPAHGYIVIWFDKETPITQLHASFKLSNDEGSLLMLTPVDNSWCDMVTYCAHNGNQTIGRFPDGSENIYLMSIPTIDKTNKMNSLTRKIPLEELDPTDIVNLNLQGDMSLTYYDNQLNVRSEVSRYATLNIFSTEGKIVKQYSLNFLSETKQQISVASLVKGLYVAQLVDNKGDKCSLKFLKED